VAGGIDVAPVLGSRSTFLPGRFGGLEGRALRRGDVLPLLETWRSCRRKRFGALKISDGRSVRWSTPPQTVPDREPILIHAIEEQHFAGFDAASQRAFFDAVWHIAPESNRMVFRLVGPASRAPTVMRYYPADPRSARSRCPASGAPIALMADHQTTGGYPRIAEIAYADVPRLAQLAPGGTVHFAKCSLDMAWSCARTSKRASMPCCRASRGVRTLKTIDLKLRHGRELRRLEKW